MMEDLAAVAIVVGIVLMIAVVVVAAVYLSEISDSLKKIEAKIPEPPPTKRIP